MTLSLVSTENQKPNNRGSSLAAVPHEIFIISLTFLEPQDLGVSARVCQTWNRHVDAEDHWKSQCQILLDLSTETEIDPRSYVPEPSSYKAIFRVVYANILGASVYERHIGKVGSVPRIPKGLSLQRWNKPDPCDPTKKIGPEYVWMYIPSHIEIDSEKGVLSKIDDPNDTEAPLLLRKYFVKRVSRAIGLETISVLKVPVTINNIKVLFEHQQFPPACFLL